MNFNIGDKISIIDENLSGKILSLDTYKAIIISDDGFEFEYQLTKLVKMSDKEDYSHTFSNIPFNKIEEKVKVISKRKNSKILTIDLHAESLSIHIIKEKLLIEQLEKVKYALKFTDKSNYSKIIFIHGKGKFILRDKIQQILRKNKYQYKEANFNNFGSGAIEVALNNYK